MKLKHFALGLAGFAVIAATLVIASGQASAASKAMPKTTGGVGYTAYGLQRYAEFNAIETSDTCQLSSWNLDGITGLAFNSTLYSGGNPYVHSIAINGTTATGSSTGNTYSATVSVTGSSVTIVATYNSGSVAYPYTYTANGTISGSGTLSGTWTGTDGDSGTWNSTTGTATKTVLGCSGKGTFHYSDVNGYWYDVEVAYVNVDGADAWFAGQVVAGNVGVGNWLFAKTSDGGEPAYLVDQIWGSFTSEASAKNGVANKANPADGPFDITSGNLQVK